MEFEQHSKIKLHMLGYYLQICSNVHKGHPDRFTYFETHAGDGIAKFSDRTQPGSALLAAANPLRFQCILAEEVHAEELERNIRKEVSESTHVKILPGDSNAIIQNLLQGVPAHFHSLAFVDPTHPGQLNWRTVKAIAEHKYTYSQTGQVRIPEILLNFPINRIKRNAGWLTKSDTADSRENRKTALHNNDVFFGTQAWRNLGPQDDLRDYYINRVMAFGYELAYWTTVEVFETNVPIYDLILFVRQKKAQEVLPGIAKHLEQWRREDYIRDVYKIHDIRRWTGQAEA